MTTTSCWRCAPAGLYRRLAVVPSLVVCALIAFTPARSQAQTPDGAWVHLDSRFFHAYSDDAVAGFGVDLFSVGPRFAGLVAAVDDDAEGRMLVWNRSAWHAVRRDVLSFAVSTFLGTAFGHAAHEYGHATRLAAVGFDPRMSHRSWSSLDDIEAGVRAGEGTNRFFPYFVTSLFDRSGSTVVTTERVLRPVDLDAFELRWDAAAVMGGLNAEMAFALRLGEEIQQGRGHAGMLATYLNGKLAARQYGTGTGALNDMTNILTWYEGQGLDIDLERIRQGSARAALLSAGTYQIGWSVISMLAGRGARTPTFASVPVLLPESGFHLGPQGISQSLHSGVRIGRWTGRVSYEWSLEGPDRDEVGLGLSTAAGPWRGDLRARVGDGLGGRLAVDLLVRDRWSVGVVASRYDPQNLFGARHATRIEGEAADHVVGLRVGMRW